MSNTDFNPPLQQLAGQRFAEAGMLQSPYVPRQPPPSPTTPQPVPSPAAPQQQPGDTELPPPHPVTTVKVPTPPMPPQRFSATPTRGWQHWGKPSWAAEAARRAPFHFSTSTSLMPSPREAPAVIAGAGRQLATWGSPGVQGPARVASILANIIGPFFDFYSGGAFGRAYDSATAARLEMQREQMAINHDRMVEAAHQTWQASKAHTDRYREIIDNIHRHFYAKDDATNQAIGYQEFINATRTDPDGPDVVLRQQAENGGLENALALLDSRDAKAHDMYLSAVALDEGPGRSKAQKSKEDAALAASLEPTAATGGLPGPGGTLAATGSAPIGEQPSGVRTLDDELARKNQISQDGVEDAHAKYRGEKPRGLTVKQYQDGAGPKAQNVDQAARDLTTAIRNEAASSDDLQTKIDKIRGYDEEAGDSVDGLINHTLDPKSPKGKQYNSLAHQVSPGPNGYDEAGYARMQDFNSEKSPVNQSMRRTQTLAASYVSVMGELKNISETDPNFIQKLKSALATGLGDPTYTSIATGLRNFGTDAVAIAYGTGRSPVSMVNHFIDNIPKNASPAQVRGWMKVDLQNAYGGVKAVKGDYQRLSRTNNLPPGLQQESDDILQYGMLTNVYSGQVAKGAPDVLKAVGNPAPSSDPKKRPSWMTPAMARPPPDTPEDADMITHALANPDAPGSQDILRHWGY